MRRTGIILLISAILGVVRVAEAQPRSVVTPRWYRARAGYVAVPHVSYHPVWGWRFPYGFSSTPVEAARRGLADVIRARGEAYERTTRGLANYEEARSTYIENRRKWQQAYRQRQQEAEAERRRKFREKREAWEKYRETKGSSYPPRLSPDELDPTTGKIYWPDALQTENYAELRRELQELLLLRAQAGSSRAYASEIHEKARAMLRKLKDHVREMPAPEYIAARNFLESLAWEGRYPAG